MEFNKFSLATMLLFSLIIFKPVHAGILGSGTLFPGGSLTGSESVSGIFSTDYTFSIDSSVTDAIAAVVNIDVGTILDFSALDVSIFYLPEDAAPDLLESGSAKLDEFFSLGTPPDAGDYKINVSGTTSGVAGGSYALTVAAIVPIPPAVFLLVTGLIGLAGIARRKKAAIAV